MFDTLVVIFFSDRSCLGHQHDTLVAAQRLCKGHPLAILLVHLLHLLLNEALVNLSHIPFQNTAILARTMEKKKGESDDSPCYRLY